MADLADVDGAEGASLTLDAPGLPAIALAWRLKREPDPAGIEKLREALPQTSSPYPWNALGSLLQGHLKRYEDAETAYRKAIEIDPSYASPWYGLGNLLQVHLKRYEDAETAYRKAIEIDPSYASPWYGLGHLLQLHLKRYEEAEMAYRKAIEIDPAYAGPWNGLAWLKYQTSKVDQETEDSSRRALSLAPDNLDILNTLAIILAHQNKWSEAAPLAKRFLGEGSPEFHEQRWSDMLTFFREAVRTHHAAEALALLDALPLADRWRPLREALHAIAEGSRLPLRRVAPEIRLPAEQLLLQLLPEGQPLP